MLTRFCFATFCLGASIALGEVTLKDLSSSAPATSEPPVKVQSVIVSDTLSVTAAHAKEVLVGLEVRDPGGALVACRANAQIKSAQDNLGNALKPADERTSNLWFAPKTASDGTQIKLTGFSDGAEAITLDGELVFRKAVRAEEMTIRPISAPQHIAIDGMDIEFSAAERKGEGWRITIKGKRPASMSAEVFREHYELLCAAEVTLASDSGVAYTSNGGGGTRGVDSFENAFNLRPTGPVPDALHPPEPSQLTIKRIAESAEVRVPLKLEGVKLP